MASNEGTFNPNQLPEFDEPAIIGFFHEVAPQFHVSIEHLKKPQPEFLVEVYRWFVQSLTNCKDGVIEQIPGSALVELEFPELHENSVPLLNLVLCLDYLLASLGYPQAITVKDIVTPSRQRSKKLISLFIDFYVFIQSRKNYVESSLQKARDISAEKRRLFNKNNELKERISAIRAEKVLHEPVLNKLKTRKEGLLKKLQEKKKKLANVKNEEDALTNEEAVLRTDLEAAKSRKATTIEKDKTLASQIVSSPETLAAELEELKHQKAEKENLLESLNSEIQALNERQEKVPQIEAALDALLTSWQKIGEENRKKDDLLRQKENWVEKIGGLRLELNDLTLTLQRSKETFDARREQLAKTQKQQNLRLAEHQKEIAKLKEQIQRLEDEQNENEVVSCSLDEDCRNMRTEINRIEREHEVALAVLNEKHESLMAALDRMNKNAVDFYDMVEQATDDVDSVEDDVVARGEF